MLGQPREITMQLSRRLHFETILLDQGVFAARAFRPSHFGFRWHYHPELELTLILKGRGLRFVGDSVQDFREGDLCLLGSGLPHSWHSAPRKGGRAHSAVIQFLPAFLGSCLVESPEMKPIRNLFDHARRGLRITGATNARVQEHMLELCRHPPASPMRSALLLMILAILAQSRQCEPLSLAQPPAAAPHIHRRLAAVFDRLNRPGVDPPRQHEAATAAGMSPAAFSRFFHRHVGKTYVGYLNELRVATACRALVETDRPIIEIAYECGFNNLSNFNRRFLMLKGATPRQYRHLAVGENRTTDAAP
jgi:AraC-like DNA-binding protein